MLQLLHQVFLSYPSHLLFTLITPLLILIFFLFKWSFFTSTSKTNSFLPPGPRKFPIIGNFHQLGTIPYRSLWSLAQHYGPLMLLKFGQVPVLVVSSPNAAREIMKKNDLCFASRPDMKNINHLFYDSIELLGLPYGEEWRQMRKVFTLHLLTKKRVQSFRTIREEETELMLSKISKSCSSSTSLPVAVNLNDLFITLVNDVGCRAAFGRKYSGENEKAQKIRNHLCELLLLLGSFTIGDYIPMLGWLDYLTGINARVRKTARGIDEFLDELIDEGMVQLEDKRAQGVILDFDKQNILDALLIMQRDNSTGIPLSGKSIKALVLDAYSGGTDTLSSFLEWSMVELLRNPNSMKKLQNEVREVLNGKVNIVEDDLEKMLYLKAVIKETFRRHPPAALTARTTLHNTEVLGYDIAAGTTVLINVWGMGNDPELWNEPHEFKPERFLNSSIDFQGHDFDFTPFGAGRRQCPGMYFATTLIEYVLVNLMRRFDWEFPGTIKGEEIDMSEKPGSAVHRKKINLQAIATPFY